MFKSHGLNSAPIRSSLYDLSDDSRSTSASKEADQKDIMPDGNNLRGKKAMDMFDRNFRRSRLGYAPKTAKKNAKTNVEVITENNEGIE